MVGRLVRNDIPPVTLTMTRWLVALACILPFSYRYMKQDFAKYLTVLPRIIAISLSGLAAFSLLVYFGLHHTSGTNALLLNSCAPALIMLFAAIFYGQKLHIRQILGLCISFAGVLTIIFKGDIAGLWSMSFASGDLLIFGAMCSFAFYTLWLKKIPADIHRLGLLGVQVIVTLIATFPLWIWEMTTAVHVEWTRTTLMAVAFLGIFPSFLAYLLFGRCVTLLGPARAGLCIHLIPVFGVTLSVCFLGEAIHAYQLAGILAILSGLAIASMSIHDANA